VGLNIKVRVVGISDVELDGDGVVYPEEPDSSFVI
jgi:hypothetical protein